MADSLVYATARRFPVAALLLLGDIAAHAGGGETRKAEEHYRQALAADELGTRPLAARCHLGLGSLFHGSGQRRKAQEHRSIATTMFREMGMPVGTLPPDPDGERPRQGR